MAPSTWGSGWRGWKLARVWPARGSRSQRLKGCPGAVIAVCWPRKAAQAEKLDEPEPSNRRVRLNTIKSMMAVVGRTRRTAGRSNRGLSCCSLPSDTTRAGTGSPARSRTACRVSINQARGVCCNQPIHSAPAPAAGGGRKSRPQRMLMPIGANGTDRARCNCRGRVMAQRSRRNRGAWPFRPAKE